MNHQFSRMNQLAKSKTMYRRALLEFYNRYESKTRQSLINIISKEDTRYDYEIVVAHYRENLDWLEPYGSLVTLYHKSDYQEFPTWIDSSRIITLENIGRESHTYLTHILERWDTLAPWTFFTQGGFNDHWYNGEVLPPSYYIFGGTVEGRYYTANLNCHRLGLPNGDNSQHFEQWWNSLKITPKPFKNYENQFQWAPGGFFTVHRDLIKSRPREFYQNILDTLQGNDPISGHYCERSWKYIFNFY